MNGWRASWGGFRKLLEMIRFSHTVFALPFALLAAAMAWWQNAHSDPPTAFSWRDLAGIVVCMVCARSAAMAFNRLADRRIDALNPRTSTRHLPAGTLSVASAAAFTALASIGFVAGTLLFLPRNPWPFAASAPVLAFLFGYSYAKRFTALAHFWLGAALMLAPVAAWVAIRAAVEWPPVVLGAAVMLWVAGFDIIYACQDAAFDVKARLFSVPARLGVAGALRVAALCHAGMVGLLAAVPWGFDGFGWIYGTAVGGIAVLLVYEHRLVRPDDLARVNQAFLHVNAAVSVGLLLAGGLDLLL
jgi:4-hydroxybenzoate polyprenyltransferase